MLIDQVKMTFKRFWRDGSKAVGLTTQLDFVTWIFMTAGIYSVLGSLLEKLLHLNYGTSIYNYALHSPKLGLSMLIMALIVILVGYTIISIVPAIMLVIRRFRDIGVKFNVTIALLVSLLIPGINLVTIYVVILMGMLLPTNTIKTKVK